MANPSKIFRNVFKSPVAWIDADHAPTTTVTVDGYEIADRLLEGCAFRCSLQEDGRSIEISISEDTASYFDKSCISFDKFAKIMAESLEDLVEDILEIRPLTAKPTKAPAKSSPPPTSHPAMLVSLTSSASLLAPSSKRPHK